VVCLTRWQNRTRCKKACALYFPNLPELKEVMRQALKEIIAACPKRDVIPGNPEFGDIKKITVSNLNSNKK